ncbi:MAG: alpha amylase C-terminal domain-containing protein [Bacteroidales bacterium]|nr:alpha amylase C-terminal domain-containing protein [Bacteroidales bacterium]
MSKSTEENKKKHIALVEQDPWLEPVEHEIEARLERYKDRLKQIENDFGSLTNFADAYQYFGIHYDEKDKGWYYREWAPAAYQIFLFGEFNSWNRTSHPLQKKEYGTWEIFLDEETYKDRFVHNSKIKVLVDAPNGWKERIPVWANRVVQDDSTKDFSGQLWFPDKPFSWVGDDFKTGNLDQLLIYETHVGMSTERYGVGTYLEFADHVLPRIKNAGYNAIQVMAIAEHPYYGSFGYHVANFFAPSSRFGTPEELKYLIKKAHSMGIAVIMDIVHSHTVKNIHEGINEFDGTDSHYTHPGDRGNHPAWDSKLFDYGKTEVLRFLLSNLKYWLIEYHFDGFRFDGVTSMMYHHHGMTAFDSREKFFSDGVEWDAITYLQLANTLIHEVKNDAISIAEDVSGMPGLCRPIEEGGIGFDYRLAMGIPDFWIRTLKEKQDENWNMDEIWNTLTDRMYGVGTIAYAESHDQALVGDKTIAFWLMDKEMYFHMHKNDDNLVIERGVALHKMIRFITIALGGQAYLNFMGNEFGHPEWIDFPREGNGWSHHHARRQWSLCDNPDLKYQYLAEWDKAMIKLIADYKVLTAGYGDLIKSDDWNKTLIFEKANLTFAFNFHINQSLADYEFFVPEEGKYSIILNSDAAGFGGHNRVDERVIHHTQIDKESNRPFIKVYIPNRTALVFEKV